MGKVSKPTSKVKSDCQSTGLKVAESTDSSSPQGRITWGHQVVTGIDKIKLGLHVFWKHQESLFFEFDRAKKQAQESSRDVFPIDLAGYGFNCHANGIPNYKYRLTSNDIVLLINTRRVGDITPNVRIEIGSISCWSPGFKLVLIDICQIIIGLRGIIIQEKLSEVHLACDFIGLPISEIPVGQMDQWVTRAEKIGSYTIRRQFSGVSITTLALSFRVYDKILELENDPTKKEMFFDIYGFKKGNILPVTRAEFEIKRTVLKELSIDTIANLEDSLTSIWQYCTNWCRLADKPIDRNHNQSHAKTHPWWEVIQSQVWSGENIVTREKIQSRKSLEKLSLSMAGYAKAIAAIYGRKEDDLEGIIAMGQGQLEMELRKQHQIDRQKFVESMKIKKNEIGKGVFDSYSFCTKCHRAVGNYNREFTCGYQCDTCKSQYCHICSYPDCDAEVNIYYLDWREVRRINPSLPKFPEFEKVYSFESTSF